MNNIINTINFKQPVCNASYLYFLSYLILKVKTVGKVGCREACEVNLPVVCTPALGLLIKLCIFPSVVLEVRKSQYFWNIFSGHNRHTRHARHPRRIHCILSKLNIIHSVLSILTGYVNLIGPDLPLS